MRIAYTYTDAWNTNTNTDAYNTDSYAECNADGYAHRYTAPPHAQAAANTVSSADSVGY